MVLVGDADQLAPVGAGKPFAELVASGAVPTARLTHIFRQAAGSMIVQGAHAIRRGAAPDFSAAEGMRRDLFLIERADPRAALRGDRVAGQPPASRRTTASIRCATSRCSRPCTGATSGSTRSTRRCARRSTRDGEPVRGGRLRIGDKLMMTGRNLHELGLMNGTLLTLARRGVGADGDDDPALILSADDESVFRLPPEEADRLRLAYACSVHRGQGIELPVAVIVAHAASGAFFLRREMLYTAVTRATIATVIVGTRDVIARAARTPDTGRRHSRLAERLVGARRSLRPVPTAADANICSCQSTARPPILHADLDSFYASVEQRDDPTPEGPAGDRRRGRRAGGELRGQGAWACRPRWAAGRREQLCPGAAVVSPRMSAYSEASKAVFSVFEEMAPTVEGLSIDEAFLDVRGLDHIIGTPIEIAVRLRREVRERVGLPITVGVARTKFLAKVASGVAKPDGLLLVPPDFELAFLHPLPVERLWGVGKVTSPKAPRAGDHHGR